MRRGMAVITVSRQLGSLGDQLAEVVARRLEYRLVGRQELVRLAAGLGEPDPSLERSPELRERSPSFWERLNEERRRYFSVLRNVVLHLAEQDDVVIVGLGAGQLLKGFNHVLRLQVVAPLDLRIERVVETGLDEIPRRLTREHARDLVRQRDRDAAGYIRYLFHIEWMEPQHWDLIINTARFAFPQAADVVVSIVERGMLAPTSEDSQRLADLTLASQVEVTLLNQPNVWVNALKVRAENGRVRIEGEVIADEDREAVEQVVRAIEGVRIIDNDLRIQPPPLTGM
jgi:cytidylate kinase